MLLEVGKQLVVAVYSDMLDFRRINTLSALLSVCDYLGGRFLDRVVLDPTVQSFYLNVLKTNEFDLRLLYVLIVLTYEVQLIYDY